MPVKDIHNVRAGATVAHSSFFYHIAYERKQEVGLHDATRKLQTRSAEGSVPLSYLFFTGLLLQSAQYLFSIITLSGDHL